MFQNGKASSTSTFLGTDHPASLRSSNNNNNHNSVFQQQQQQHQRGATTELLEADAAASVLADRMDNEALHHELARLELVVSTQQKQLSELISQRAQHVATIADLKSMLEAVSRDRSSMTEINNALRNEARAAEAEVVRLQGEIAGLRGNLTRVRQQSATGALQQKLQENQQQGQQNQGSFRGTISPTKRNHNNNNGNGGQQQQQQKDEHQKNNSGSNQNHNQKGMMAIYGRPVNTVSLPNQPVATSKSSAGGRTSRNYNYDD
jgi:hypothetical protein